MRFATLVLALGFVVIGAAEARTKQSGLYGDVTRGPIAPVCVAAQPCTEPAKHVTLLFSRNGQIAGRSVTDSAGRYRVRLPAGIYAVRRSATSAVDRRLEPNLVRVRAGRFARVDFSIDTGIR
jgi:hypothetical protein